MQFILIAHFVAYNAIKTPVNYGVSNDVLSFNFYGSNDQLCRPCRALLLLDESSVFHHCMQV
jgi:hypothetical protein